MMAAIMGLLPSSICEHYSSAHNHQNNTEKPGYRSVPGQMDVEIPGGPLPHAGLWTRNARQPKSRFVLNSAAFVSASARALNLSHFASADLLHGRTAHALVSRELIASLCGCVPCFMLAMLTWKPVTGHRSPSLHYIYRYSWRQSTSS